MNEIICQSLVKALNNIVVARFNRLRKRVSLWLKKPLTQAQIAGWAEVARDIGQVVFASLVVEGLTGGEFSLEGVVIGLLISTACWLVSHQLNARIKL